MKKILLPALGLFLGLLANAQHVGIGTSVPQEPLEVAGIIYTSEGGIKFPDQTVQTTAAMSASNPTTQYQTGIGYARFNNADLNGDDQAFGMTKLSTIYSLSFTNQVYYESSGSGGGGPIIIANPVQIIKKPDRGTPGFFKYMASQGTIANMEFFLTRENTTTGDPEIYMKIKTTDSHIAGFDFSHVPGYNGYYLDREVVTIGYKKIYISNISPATCYCFDFLTQQECSGSYNCN